jgi:hypothetical protein
MPRSFGSRESEGLGGEVQRRRPPGAAVDGAAERRTLTPNGVLALQGQVGNQAVQRLAKGDGTIPVQRRLSFEGTQWNRARHLDASREGGGGVLFVGEDTEKEIVVKPGEDRAPEGALASLLLGKVGRKGPKIGAEAIGGAPGFRVVDPTEAALIEQALQPLLRGEGSGKDDNEKFRAKRARDLVGRLRQPGVVVQDMAKGLSLDKAVRNVEKHTQKTFLGMGPRKLREDSPLRIFTDPRSIRSMGLTSGVDILTGNMDRVVGQFNAENFHVTPTSITAIDNIWMGTDMSVMRTTQMEGRYGAVTVTADEGMDLWKGHPRVRQFASGEFGTIAGEVFNGICDAIELNMLRSRAVDRPALKAIMNKNRAKFVTAFADGLREAKQQILASLAKLINNPAKLQQMAPGVDLDEIIETMRKRREFLQNGEG